VAVVAPARAPVAPRPKVQLPEAPAPVEEEEKAPARPAPRVERAPSGSALTAELGALDEARSRLASGDASGALAKLDEYSRTYPRGRLVLEAEVLRIDALAKSGQQGAANKRAEQFLKRHPNSVLASRVRTYLTE
jgi:TolA-binding protein